MIKRMTLVATAILASQLAYSQWTSLATDVQGDGANSALLDGTAFSYMYDNQTDSVWFKVTVNTLKISNFGINIILDVDGGGTKANWFGTNMAFTYNRILTAWIGSSTGTIGIADAAGFQNAMYTNLGANNMTVMLDGPSQSYLLGVKRTSIFNGTRLTAKVIAAVGSDQLWNDDVPNSGAGNIDLAPITTGIKEQPDLFGQSIRVYPNPSNGLLQIQRINNFTEPYTLYVYNNAGILVSTFAIADEKLIDLTGISKGTYWLRMSTQHETAVKSIIIY